MDLEKLSAIENQPVYTPVIPTFPPAKPNETPDERRERIDAEVVAIMDAATADEAAAYRVVHGLSLQAGSALFRAHVKANQSGVFPVEEISKPDNPNAERLRIQLQHQGLICYDDAAKVWTVPNAVRVAAEKHNDFLRQKMNVGISGFNFGIIPGSKDAANAMEAFNRIEAARLNSIKITARIMAEAHHDEAENRRAKFSLIRCLIASTVLLLLLALAIVSPVFFGWADKGLYAFWNETLNAQVLGGAISAVIATVALALWVRYVWR